MATSTNYPNISAADNTIYLQVINTAVPMFNAAIEQYFGSLSSTLQFTAASTFNADNDTISEPSICVYVPQDDWSVAGNQVGVNTFTAIVSLKLPWIVAPPALYGNEPEAFNRIATLFRDTVASVFYQAALIPLAAVNATGGSTLPAGQNYIHNLLYRRSIINRPRHDSTGKLLFRYTDCYLSAQVPISSNRVGL